MSLMYFFFSKNLLIFFFFLTFLLIDESIYSTSLMMIFMCFFLMKFLNLSFKSKFLNFFFFLKKSNIYMMVFFFFFFFFSNSLVIFYVSFEMLSLIMFFQIIFSSFSSQRLKASIYMFLFMSMGTFPLVVLLFFVNMNFMIYIFSLSFLVKLPMFFFHLWLPKAHVEANFYESMILASILLKLGGFGLMNLDMNFMFDFIFLWSLLSCFIVSFIIMFIIDMKIIFAYSSIIHMNMLIFIMIFNSKLCEMIFLLIMISHGFISSMMFYFIGLIYESTFSRSMLINKSFFLNCSLIYIIFFLLILANCSTPPFLSFFSEFYLFYMFYFFMSEFYIFFFHLIFLLVLFNLILMKNFGMMLLVKFFNYFYINLLSMMIFFFHFMLMFFCM